MINPHETQVFLEQQNAVRLEDKYSIYLNSPVGSSNQNSKFQTHDPVPFVPNFRSTDGQTFLQCYGTTAVNALVIGYWNLRFTLRRCSGWSVLRRCSGPWACRTACRTICYLFIGACDFFDLGCKKIMNIHRYFYNIFLGYNTDGLVKSPSPLNSW